MSVRSNRTDGAVPSRIRRGVQRVSAVLVLAVLTAACAEDKPLNTFEPRGPRAERIDSFMMWIWPIMGIIFVLVVFGAIIIAWRNRVNEEDYDPEDLPEQVHGNTPLELAWTIAPAVLLAAICVPMVGLIWELEETNDTDGDLDVMVIGQQWWWEYRYDVNDNGFFIDANGDGVANRDLTGDDATLPINMILDPEDVVTANELVIPTGQQVDLILTSRDVIHSYWIPRLNGKRDTVPGRWHTWSLEADEPGKFTGWCTEYCGLSHARMRMAAIALDPADYDAWLANQTTMAEIPAEGSEEAAGRELFMNNCSSCHIINDGEMDAPIDVPLVAGAAPNLTHFATRTTFAGGIYGIYAGGPGDATEANGDGLPVDEVYLNIAEIAADPTTAEDYRFNAAELKRWIANAPSRKAMAPDPNEDGLGRGMPAFEALTDQQLDQIIAYLATLD
jgi:cytochrome c oxidase subunit 2